MDQVVNVVEAKIPSPEGEEEDKEIVEDETKKDENGDNVKVIFVMEDSSEKFQVDFKLSDSVAEMKDWLSRKWIRNPDTLTISLSGETLSNSTTIEQLGTAPGHSIELHIQVLTSSEHMSVMDKEPAESVPKKGGRQKGSSVFTVEVRVGQELKEILISMEKAKVKKPFLGGYKNQLTEIEYHHASAQTLPKSNLGTGITKFERDTQTVLTRNKPQQVMVDATTQMNQTGCFITSRTDKILFPKKYETADEYHAKILQKVILLQSYWRRWLGSQYVKALRKEKYERMIWEKEEQVRKQKEKEERKRKEFDHRMNPRTKEDFDLLYHALEMWRQDELNRINQTTSGPERKAALYMLLEQEAHLIASISRHKIVADEENKEVQIKKFLEATAAPKKWIAYDGQSTEMDTRFTLRATQLKDLYDTIVMSSLEKDERLDALLTLKATVREQDCKLTREIVELVDREADLLVRDTKTSALQGLRKRIATLFLQYCKTPLFNPEAAKHIKVPQDPSILRANIYYCRSCCQYLPSTDFELSTNSRVVGHCRQCRELDNKARAREDFTLYRAMLKTIRRTEEGYKDDSHIIFLLQESDLCYLVENIWASQSAMSAEKDLFELIMVRWDVRQPWSPWNSILLTKDEAQPHVKLEDPEQAYGSQFVQKTKHRHVLAKNYFTKLPGMSGSIRSKITELPLPRPKERIIIPQGVGAKSPLPISTK